MTIAASPISASEYPIGSGALPVELSPRSLTAPSLRDLPAEADSDRPDPQVGVHLDSARAGSCETSVERDSRQFGRMSARSEPMRAMFNVAERLTVSNVTVTILGETGTGKDVLAHALHAGGSRARGPFVVFDCASVPANLVESELFGHERGSFTGAVSEHVGAFERAAKGTLFLDEIGELPLELQPRLLRALDGQAFRRVGGTRDRRVDVRVVAATNRDLASLMGARRFRQDLYFRLAAATIQLPPLRDRIDDLALLVTHLLGDLGRGDVSLSDDAWSVLRGHSWPGNVRELKNALALALTFLDGALLEARHFRFVVSSVNQEALDRLALGGHALEDLERVAIGQTMNQTRGNKIQAARLLGIAASTLYEKLQKYRRQ